MADYVEVTPGTGAQIAVDEVTGGPADGLKVQRFKPGFGPDGEYRDVTPEAGLPVSPASRQFTASTNLPEAELFSADVSAFRWVTLAITGLPTTDPIAWVSVEVSANGSDWWPLDQLYDFSEQRLETELQTDTVAAGPVFAQYMRAVLHTNDNEPAAGLIDVTALFSAAPSQIVGLGADLRWQGAPVDSYHALPVGYGTETSFLSLTADGEYLMSANVARYRQVLYQVSGPFTGSIAFEVSLLGSDYVALPVTPAGDPGAPQMAVTAPGLYVLQTQGADFIRAAMTGYADGAAAIYGQLTALPGTAGGGGDLSYDGTAVTAAGGLPTAPASKEATYSGTVHGSVLFTEDVTGWRGISITASDWLDDGWAVYVQVSNDGTHWGGLPLWSADRQEVLYVVNAGESREAPLSYRYVRGTLQATAEADLSEPASVVVEFSAAVAATQYTVAQLMASDGTLVGPNDPMPVSFVAGDGSVVGPADPLPARLYAGGLTPVGTSNPLPVAITGASPDLYFSGTQVSTADRLPTSAVLRLPSGDNVDGDHPLEVAARADLRVAGADVSGGNPVPVSGTVGISGTVPVSAASALATTGGYTELTGSASANSTDLIASTDVRGYRSFSIQLTGSWTATVQVQQSNDAVTWFTAPLITPSVWNAGSPSAWSTAGMQGAAFYAGVVIGRYLRVRTTAYSSGTVTAIVELSQHVVPDPPYMGTDSSGTLKIKPDTGAVSLADARNNNQWQMETSAGGYVYNGASWDRMRGANGANGTTGTGLAGAGQLGYDGTNWRRLRSSVATSAHTAVANSVTSVNLLAANSAREMATFYNDSASAYCYLKLGTTASATSFTYRLSPGAYYELPRPVWAGAVDAIADVAVGSVRIGEFT